MAENVSLREAILKKSCFTCSGTMVPAELLAENRPLLMENGRLRGEYTHHTHRTMYTHSTLTHTHV